MLTAELTGNVCVQPGTRTALAAPGMHRHCGELVVKGCPLKSTGQLSTAAEVADRQRALTRHHLGDLKKVKTRSVTFYCCPR